MNDTHQSPPTSGTTTSRRGFAAFADVRRTRDDRMVAGVAGGVARRFDVDPVLVRILLVVLCFVGLAGLILYVAGWLFLPAEDEPRSNVAEWFGLEDSESQVRDLGLVAATVLAVLAVVGDGGWGPGPGSFWHLVWLGLPIALVVWLVSRVRRPAARAAAADPTGPADGTAAFAPADTGWPGSGSGATTDTAVDGASTVPPATPPASTLPPAPPRPPRRRFTWVPTLLTIWTIAIATAVTWLVADPEWTAYVAVALAVTGLGLLACTFVRGGLPLVLLGLLLTGLLAAGTALPSLRMGDQRVTPTSAGQLQPVYEHGMGRFELDLTDVDPDALVGRTVTVDTGLGQTIVTLPSDLPVDVDATVRAGDLEVLGERVSGTSQELTTNDDEPGLTLRIEHTAGQVEVTRR